MGADTDCNTLETDVLQQYDLIFVSNRGPFSFVKDETGEVQIQRGGGGLVTALLGLASQVPSTWIAAASSEEDQVFKEGKVALESGGEINMRFVAPDPEAYDGYYGVISNPLLWFLQHSIWNLSSSPTINHSTWQAWDDGYVKVNWLFAEAVAQQVRRNQRPSLVMLQDYHLYLAPAFIRDRLRSMRWRRRDMILTHFVHIPWPGPEDWGLLPGRMRRSILEGLCAVDMVGFQTREDGLNFIRSCETLLPDARVNYRKGRVSLHHHTTHVRDFPISIDVQALCSQAASDGVAQIREQLSEQLGGRKAILRIDRTEPSKNIVRGFQAYEELLELHPEHRDAVQFIAILVPSRLEVEEYQDYLSALMAAAGRINARFGSSDWEPVRVLVGESYPRAVAAMQLYDVLLVNPVADGMNLVAKEGPMVNERDGVLVLSERAGAHQQLGEDALVIAPIDVSATAEALHRALIMPEEERKQRSARLKQTIEREDIHLWMCWQLDTIRSIIMDGHGGKTP